MGLFKDVKKPVIKSGASGGDVSPLRPRYVEKLPPCAAACPAGGDIRGWVTTIAEAQAYGRTTEQAIEHAWLTITDRNPFPAVCGRVCPHPCEGACNRLARDSAVAINSVERFVGDFAIERGWKLRGPVESGGAGGPAESGKVRSPEESGGVGAQKERVVVVGAGPAGLSCAYQLARRGYPVTVLEACDSPGGRLRHVQERHLPAAVRDAEIARIVALGIDLRCNTAVGRDVTLEQLRQDFSAVFIGVGRPRPQITRSNGPQITQTDDPQITKIHTGQIRTDFETLTTDGGWIVVDDEHRTRVAGVYAGGDVVELALVPTAIAQGRLAADAIGAHLGGTRVERQTIAQPIRPDRMKLSWYKETASAFGRFAETTAAVSEEERWLAATEETKRCMSCGACMDCETCWMYCTNNCFVKLPKGQHYRLKLEVCNGCRKCADECPSGYIEMG